MLYFGMLRVQVTERASARADANDSTHVSLLFFVPQNFYYATTEVSLVDISSGQDST